MNHECLINRKVIDILIGDIKIYNGEGLPYMSGSDLCSLCTTWGLPMTYTWGAINLSRWQYMQKLLQHVAKQNKVEALLAYLFDFSRFNHLQVIKDPNAIKKTYQCIVDNAIAKINDVLLFSQNELRIINKQFVLCSIGEDPVIIASKVKVVTYQYIRELPDRIKDDIEAHDYDSVVTKSRTLLEEVLIYIIEKTTHERFKSNGDLMLMYNEVRNILGIKQQKDWDKRVNELLGSIYNIVNVIASMRNMNSDAHGAGCGRIQIHQREAMLIANSAVMIAEYWLSIFNKEKE